MQMGPPVFLKLMATLVSALEILPGDFADTADYPQQSVGMRRETSLATMEAAAPCSRRTGNVCAGQVSLESGVKRTSTSVPPIPASMEDCAGTWSTGSYASVMWPSLASAVSWT